MEGADSYWLLVFLSIVFIGRITYLYFETKCVKVFINLSSNCVLGNFSNQELKSDEKPMEGFFRGRYILRERLRLCMMSIGVDGLTLGFFCFGYHRDLYFRMYFFKKHENQKI